MADEQGRVTLTAAQSARLVELLAGEAASVREAAERIGQGQVVPDAEAESVRWALEAAKLLDGYDGEKLNDRGREIEGIISVVMQRSQHPRFPAAEEPAYCYDGISSAGLRRAAALMWPRWVEVSGCVLREEVADAEAVADWLARPDGSVQETESVLNHVHLYRQVDYWDEPDELLDERLMDVAERIAAAWSASLREAFPGRAFSVEVASPEEDYGPTIYCWSLPANPTESGG